MVAEFLLCCAICATLCRAVTMCKWANWWQLHAILCCVMATLWALCSALRLLAGTEADMLGQLQQASSNRFVVATPIGHM